MQHVSLFDGTELRRRKRDQSRRDSLQCHKLDLIGLFLSKYVHDRSDIAFFEAMFR